MYIKSQGLENSEDRGSLLIPPSDPVHKLLASYSSANTTKGAEKSAKPSSAEPGSAVPEMGELPAEAADEEDTDLTEAMPALPIASGYSALFGAPLSGPGATEIKMKIHSGGLRSVDDGAPPHSSAGPTNRAGAWGAAAGNSGVGNRTSTAPAIAGGSSVGGWGVDKGTEWRPVSLSTARATASAAAATAANKSSSKPGSVDREFPSLGSAGLTGHGKAKAGSAPSAGRDGGGVYTELPSDLHMKKEDVYKAVLKKMSPYFGVISHNGKHYRRNSEGVCVLFLLAPARCTCCMLPTKCPVL
jgi:hypothetical protein